MKTREQIEKEFDEKFLVIKNEYWCPWFNPINILRSILNDIALRASELNDKELNKLMMRLALYEVADPYSDKYDPDFVQEYLNS